MYYHSYNISLAYFTINVHNYSYKPDAKHSVNFLFVKYIKIVTGMTCAKLREKETHL